MCVAQGNLTGRLLGDNFKKLDPLMAAGERFDAKNVAPLWKGTQAPAPAAPAMPFTPAAPDPAKRKPGATMLGG